MDVRFISAGIFLAVYLFLVLSHRFRALAIWVGVFLLLSFRVVSVGEALKAVNWNVVGIFWGTLIIAEIFIYSGLPARLANRLVRRSNSVGMAILLISVLAGFISSFCENVATVLIIAPIALEIARRLKTSPVPFLIGIAVSSNLQGAATLIGDPPSMILAGFTKLTFNDFFFFEGRLGIFFAVQLGALVSLAVLYLLFRRFTQPVVEVETVRVKTWTPAALLVLMTISLAISSGFRHRFGYLAGLVCSLFGVIGLFWYWLKGENVGQFLKSFDWETMLFLIGIFILVGSLTATGVVDSIAGFISRLTGGELFLTYTVLVWFSVFISAFVDNVPYVTAMIPVGMVMAKGLGISPYLFAFGIVIGASVGGNITPIGASANIVAVGRLKKEGYQVSFLDFARIGLPFTIAAVGAAYLFIWWIWR